MAVRRKVTRTGAKPTKRQKKITLSDEQIEKQREADAELAKELSKIKHYTVVPAGLPPYDLEGDDYDSIFNWVQQIKSTGNHSVQSCQFWVKYFYDPFQQKDQWRAVRQVILDNHEKFGIPNIEYDKTPSKIDRSKMIGWDYDSDGDSESF